MFPPINILFVAWLESVRKNIEQSKCVVIWTIENFEEKEKYYYAHIFKQTNKCNANKSHMYSTHLRWSHFDIAHTHITPNDQRKTQWVTFR